MSRNAAFAAAIPVVNEVTEQFLVPIRLKKDDEAATNRFLLRQCHLVDEISQVCHLNKICATTIPEIEGVTDTDGLKVVLTDHMTARKLPRILLLI